MHQYVCNVRSRRVYQPMKALTQPEVLKVLKAAADNPTGGRVRLLWATRDHAMILMAFRHGMRASEVCNLEL